MLPVFDGCLLTCVVPVGFFLALPSLEDFPLPVGSFLRGVFSAAMYTPYGLLGVVRTLQPLPIVLVQPYDANRHSRANVWATRVVSRRLGPRSTAQVIGEHASYDGLFYL